MARLTQEQWEQARADYEIGGLSQAEIVSKYGVSKSTVSERVKKEGWQEGKTELTEQVKTRAIIDLLKTEQQTELLTRTEQAVFDAKVADEVAFRIQNDEDMDKVRKHAMSLLSGVDKVSDLKALMDLLRIQREARLGKNPETAIQINNQVDPIAQLMKEISDEAQ